MNVQVTFNLALMAFEACGIIAFKKFKQIPNLNVNQEECIFLLKLIEVQKFAFFFFLFARVMWTIR